MTNSDVICWDNIGDTVANGYIAIHKIKPGKLGFPNGATVCLRGCCVNPVGKRVVLTEKVLNFEKSINDFMGDLFQKRISEMQEMVPAPTPPIQNGIFQNLKRILIKLYVIKEE